MRKQSEQSEWVGEHIGPAGALGPVAIEKMPRKSRRYELLGSPFFQFSAILIIPLSVAFGLRWIFFQSFAWNVAFVNTAVHVAMSALIISFCIYSVRKHPDVEVAWYAVFIVAFSFLLNFSIIVAFRVEYNSFIIVVSHAVMAVLCLGMLPWISEFRHLRVVAIPGGEVRQIKAYFSEKIRFIDSPEQPVLKNEIVVVDMRYDHFAHWERYIAECTINGIPVYHYKSIIEKFTGSVKFDHISENDFGHVLPSLFYIDVKAIIDRTVALFVLPLIIPIILSVYIIIKIFDKGPVFFIQDRIGYKGNKFKIIKFRSMRVDNAGIQSKLGSLNYSMTLENDPRITRVGSILRKYRIDELPQIFNILRGEMSWIGPRPEAVSLSEEYERSIPFYRYRHAVRPGITGWAQINLGHVTSIDDVRKKLGYDFYYIKNVSLVLDLIILARTIKTVLFGHGAK